MVANKLATEIELAGIVIDQGTSGRGRWRRLRKRYTVGQLASRVYLRVLALLRRMRIIGVTSYLRF